MQDKLKQISIFVAGLLIPIILFVFWNMYIGYKQRQAYKAYEAQLKQQEENIKTNQGKGGQYQVYNIQPNSKEKKDDKYLIKWIVVANQKNVKLLRQAQNEMLREASTTKEQEENIATEIKREEKEISLFKDIFQKTYNQSLDQYIQDSKDDKVSIREITIAEQQLVDQNGNRLESQTSNTPAYYQTLQQFEMNLMMSESDFYPHALLSNNSLIRQAAEDYILSQAREKATNSLKQQGYKLN